MPKNPVEKAEIRAGGVVGDKQRNLQYHGGPMRAVSMLSLEVIERIAAEGHPIRPGSTGENMTLTGLDWDLMIPGTQLTFDNGVLLELTTFAPPCRTIQGSFEGQRISRLSQKVHPGSSRIYARVLVEGEVVVGEGVSA